MSKKLQEQIDKIKKSIVNNNLTNTSMATYGKLNKIGQSLYRYDQLSKAGLKDEAKAEITKANNLISNFNSSEDGEPIKGYISNTRYVWAAEDGACDDCMALNGTEYENPDDAPIPLHPNCKCRIKEIYDEDPGEDDEPCDCTEELDPEIDDLISNAENLQDEITLAIDEFKNSLVEDYIAPVKNSIENYIDELYQIFGTIGAFIQNYFDMRFANTKGADKYFHAKANCTGAQLGEKGEEVTKGISDLREKSDHFFDIYAKGKTEIESAKNSAEDQKANEYGRNQGRENPEDYCGDLIKILRPEGLPERY